VSAATWIGVAVLAGTGAVARFLLDAAVSARAGSRLPAGTLAVNLSGAFALGLLTGLDVTGDALELAGTAFLGAFTTFSTWMYESQRLVEAGDAPAGAANLLIPLAAGLGAAALGRAIGGAV
jgi:CrcB protein